MAIHGLTRVECRGDKVVVVAGPVPAHIAEQMVAEAPQPSPMTQRHLAKQPVKPPRFVVEPKVEPQAVPIQASEQKENDSGS